MKKYPLLYLISSIGSFVLGGYTLYLSILGNIFFIPICVYYILEGIFLLTSLGFKDEYKKMRYLSVFQIIGVILMMCYLLFMIVWKDDGKMVYEITYFVLGGACLIKTVTALTSGIMNVKEYNTSLHSLRDSDIITITYLILIAQLVIITRFDSPDRAIWLYVIEVLSNATLTVISAYIALALAVTAFKKERTTFTGTFKSVGFWFSENEVGLFFGLIFTVYLAVAALINMRSSFFYIFIFIFYLVMAFLRIQNYLWHRKIVKNSPGNQERINHYSSKILIFDGFIIYIVALAFFIGALMMCLDKFKTETNIYYFLLILIPFTIMKIVTAIVSFKNNRKNEDMYVSAKLHVSLVSLAYSILGVIAISCYPLPVAARIAIVIVFDILFLLYTHYVVFQLGRRGFIGLLKYRKRRRIKKRI